MAYKQLTVESVIDYLAQHPSLADRFSGSEPLAARVDVTEIGDGNLNYVYRVTHSEYPDQTVIVKQAVPFLRVVGEGWPLPRERMTREATALKLQMQLCPALVPELYHFDEEMSLIVMQNLSAHNVLRGEMIQGKKFENLSDHISTFLAETLFATSDFCLSPEAKKKAVAENINSDLCKITEDFVFTHPYEDNDTNVYPDTVPQSLRDLIQKKDDVRAAVAEMKYKFMTEAQALLHGDLHTGSVMANSTETYVIDPEFAFFGPMGFDIGAFIANMYLSYFAHAAQAPDSAQDPEGYAAWHLEVIEETIAGFEQKFLTLWRAHDQKTGTSFMGRDLSGKSAEAFRQKFLSQLLSDALGFAACKMMRRIVGLAKVADIAELENPQYRALAEKWALSFGSHLVVQRHEYRKIKTVNIVAADMVQAG